MTLNISPPIPLKQRIRMPQFWVRGVDLLEASGNLSPVTVLDEFQVAGRPFPPHPHAGFSAVTYVLPTSPGGLRSRDSLGHDLTVGPGGMVWTEAGRGVLHHEVPAKPGDMLHGLQFFVNASAKTKLNAPRIFWVQPEDVPVHHGAGDETVRVVVGTLDGLASPLEPSEPFTLLDISLAGAMTLPLPPARYGIVYLRSGTIRLAGADGPRTLNAGEVATVHGSPGLLSIEALAPANLLLFAGVEISDSVVVHGGFIMNSVEQIDAALARYRRGDMGHLSSDPDAARDRF